MTLISLFLLEIYTTNEKPDVLKDRLQYWSHGIKLSKFGDSNAVGQFFLSKVRNYFGHYIFI